LGRTNFCSATIGSTMIGVGPWSISLRFTDVAKLCAVSLGSPCHWVLVDGENDLQHNNKLVLKTQCWKGQG
jgi:hypothetical protein